MSNSDDFIIKLCDELIDDLNVFSQIIEWDYPLEFGIDCEKVIDHVKAVKGDNVESQDAFYISCYADNVVEQAKKWLKDNKVTDAKTEAAFWDALIKRITAIKEANKK